MNAKTKAVIIAVYSVIMLAVGFSICFFAGRAGLAKAQAELDRSAAITSELARVNKIERGLLDSERIGIERSRREIDGERKRLDADRLGLDRARKALDGERKRLANEFETYSRIEGLLSDSLKILDKRDKN